MSQRRAVLAVLCEELKNIQVLDRVHDFSIDADAASERAHLIRQMRRKQIIDEIARLRASGHQPPRPAWIGSVLVFVFAVGYAMFHYLLK